MSDDRIAVLAREIESAYPGTRVWVEPHSNEEDPAIRAFLWILDSPGGKLCAVEDFAIDRALEIYAGAPLPFHVSAVSPETTARCFTGKPARPSPTAPRSSESASEVREPGTDGD